ncbi:lipid phosphate phosphatase epsilon 2, chloroplastic-like [Carex rostrata]
MMLRNASLRGHQNIGLVGFDFESALNRTSKWLVTSLFGVAVLWRRDAGSLWAMMGLCINSWISIKLKKVLNRKRPTSAYKPDPGMPSSHAQNIFYGVVFANMSLLKWLGTNFSTVTMGILILLVGSYFAWLRISQKLHTVEQVIVGAVLGFAFGIAWFFLWHSFMFNAYHLYFLVRVVIVLSSLASCGAFFFYFVRHWF